MIRSYDLKSGAHRINVESTSSFCLLQRQTLDRRKARCTRDHLATETDRYAWSKRSFGDGNGSLRVARETLSSVNRDCNGPVNCARCEPIADEIATQLGLFVWQLFVC